MKKIVNRGKILTTMMNLSFVSSMGAFKSCKKIMGASKSITYLLHPSVGLMWTSVVARYRMQGRECGHGFTMLAEGHLHSWL